MEVYNTIIQKMLNTKNTIYNLGNIHQCRIQNVISNGDQQFLVSIPVYNKYLEYHLWLTISTNERVNTLIQNLVKQLFYLFIFNPSHNIDRLNNTNNYILLKFRFLKKVFENPFYNQELRDEVLRVFSISQRTYFALVKFVKICKHKSSSVYNSTDILMNPINRGRPSVIEIHQNNKIYLFTRPDIINILNVNLSHSPNFFSEPLTIKNPYNNMVFRKSDLYNFYFFLRSGLFIISDLIQQFFLSNFNIYHFKKNNEYNIRDYYIKNYVETTTPDSILLDIEYMLATLTISKKIHIDRDFPKDKLIQIMRPYLLLYYQSIYSINLCKRTSCADELIIRFIKFINFNPKFGRKIIKFQKGIRSRQPDFAFKTYKPYYKKTILFNEAHISYYNKDHSFMTNQSNIEESDSDTDSTVSDV